MPKYCNHSGPFFETQTVKSLLLLFKLRSLSSSNLKTFQRSQLKIE